MSAPRARPLVHAASIVLGVFNMVLVAVIAVLVATSTVERGRQASIMEHTPGQASPEFFQLRDSQIAEISTYRVIDEEAGIYTVPIERAIDLMQGGSDSSARCNE